MACEIDCPTMQSRLTDALAALHALNTGASTVSVTYGPSKSTTYNQASIAELRRYIAELRAEIDRCCGTGGEPRTRAAVRFNF